MKEGALVKRLRDEGYSLREIVQGCPGISIEDLRSARYTVHQLKGAGIDPNDMYLGGYDLPELAMTFTISEIARKGFVVDKGGKRQGVYIPAEEFVRHCHATFDQLIEAGYRLQECVYACEKITRKSLRKRGYSVEQLKRINFR